MIIFFHLIFTPQFRLVWFSFIQFSSSSSLHRLITNQLRARVASGGDPPGPVEQDPSSLWMGLWMDLFSLDSVILIIVTCNSLPFSYFGVDFRRHISWQVLKIAFRSLQIWKLSRRGYPQDPSTRLVHWTLAIVPPTPVTKNLFTVLQVRQCSQLAC